ncbi:hypothetical protein BO70DRAFT_357666 [Aspergillus heteromorphus CBS 117.55]|uniref:Uncharacterized protein n=1 Tax=Aspergillus heteromorphus CBS 117.55 TaxID=1448321 RepID=A0A317X7G7_9EURO|nr:uncharacterized protein BO70DRAFT_357666 [Aspergillus heteromorphus CBS 117.55]PWY92540.1 hypothetical protein BO70DRAFT_357666 [Aspergillus heteromorphus CBS 117.55]
MPFDSPKRKRASSEESDNGSPPVSPTSTVSLPSLQEVRIRETEDLGRYSPRALVAGRLGQLAIRGDHISTTPIPYGLDQGTAARSLQPESWSASYDQSHDTYHMPETSRDSPSPSGPSEFADASQPPDHDESPSASASASASASPRKKQSTPSPRKRRISSTTPKKRSGKGSPPLMSAASENPLTWRDSEITGHNPNDPTDDGYGMNGIGFKPTAAMAWARSQRRQKQVAEWKNREAREARERRRERRDGAEFDNLRTIQSGAIQKKVKFDV